MSQRECLLANADAVAGMLLLADKLRRGNAAKWDLTLSAWQAAVRGILCAPVPHADHPASVVEAIREARSAGLRLGDSGEARLGSVSVGRDPDSSLAGARFYDDFDSAARSLAKLREVVPAGPGVALDVGGK
jgi:hypothetical protein